MSEKQPDSSDYQFSGTVTIQDHAFENSLDCAVAQVDSVVGSAEKTGRIITLLRFGLDLDPLLLDANT